MISHEHKCIFIHIPKCAGTSIESALGHFDGFTGRGGQDHRTIRMIERPSLSRHTFSSRENIIKFVRRQKVHYIDSEANHRNKFTVTEQQYKSYFKFTIVRNPWARALSWYKNVMRDDTHLNVYGITNDMTFKAFLKRYAGSGMLQTQLYWLKSFDGSIPLDYVGRFENLQGDVNSVFTQLNAEHLSLPHKIKGSGGDYRAHYDDETHDIILDIYKEEIDLFDYSFN